MNFIKNCKFCGKEFIAKTSRAEVCSQYCRSKLQTKKEREKRFKFLLENGIEREDYIIDKCSGNPTTTLFGSYMQKLYPDKSIEDYKSDFPDAPLMCEKYKQQISVNSGKHMKLPKYKKLFSELNKGENNPNSKANTTEQQRKSRSPFSKKFYEIRNLSEGERLSFINKVTKLKPVESWNTHIEFYTNKGLSYEDAKLALSKRQHTYKGGKFSKICQKIYK